MLAAERQRRHQKQMERRAKPARRSSRFMYPKTAARRLHQSRSLPKNQNPQNGHLMARFDWGLGAVCFGASPVAAVFGSAPGSATPPEHRTHSNPNPLTGPSKQDISTLLGIGHFYFALTQPSPACRTIPGVGTAYFVHPASAAPLTSWSARSSGVTTTYDGFSLSAGRPARHRRSPLPLWAPWARDHGLRFPLRTLPLRRVPLGGSSPRSESGPPPHGRAI